MPAPVTPRWEWRTFGDAFDDVDRLVRGPERRSSETYILSGADDLSVKIREAALEIKRLDRIEEGLELWVPILKRAFPLDPADVRDVFRHWAGDVPDLALAGYSPADLLAVLTGAGRFHIIDVDKVRRTDWFGGCIIEYATVTVGDDCVRTVCLEHPDAGHVLAARRVLRFDELDNVSYPAFLNRRSDLHHHRVSLSVTGAP